MFISERDSDEMLSRAAERTGLSPIVDFSAAYSRDLDDTRYRLQSLSAERALAEEYEIHVEDIHKATGQRLVHPMMGAAAYGSIDPAANLSAFHAKVEELAAKHPGLAVKSADDIQGQVFAKARALKDRADARDAVRVGWSGLGSFLGSAQGTMEDPLNIISMFLGAGGPRTVLAAGVTLAERLAGAGLQVGKVAGREAAINAGTEAAVQTKVMDFNRDAGIDYGVKDAALSVAMAGAGGAVLGGGMEAAGMGARSLLRRWDDAKASGKAAADPEVEAAAKVLEADAESGGINPFQGTVEGGVVFTRGMSEATAAVINGKTVAVPAVMRAEADDVATVLEGTLGAPLSHPYALVARMEAEHIDAVLFAKGPAALNANGEMMWQGGMLQHLFGHRGRGMVKILWKHGEKSGKAGGRKMVTREDILRTPLVVRALEEAPGDDGKTLRWVVDRADGERLVYVADKARQGGNEWEILSIHVLEDKLRKDNPPSRVRQGAELGPAPTSQSLDQATRASDPGQSAGPSITNIAPPAAKSNRPATLAAELALPAEPNWWQKAEKAGDMWRMPILDTAGNEVGDLTGFLGRSSVDAIEPDLMRIHLAGIDAEAKGKGHGVAAYRQLADWALANGKKMTSDAEVSEDAVRVYEALRRRGYTVEQNQRAAWTTFDDGERKLVAHRASSWVFKVSAGPKIAVRKSNRPAPLPPELTPPSAKRPETLVGWLKRAGGIRDDDGWLAHMGVDNTMRPGLVSGRGMDLDSAGLRAWEEGFFPELAARPTPDELRLHMAAELGPEGLDRVRMGDEASRLEWDAYEDMMADLDRMGVDPRGKSWAQVEAEVTAARAAERADGDLWREAFAVIKGPDAARALDADTQFANRVHGELLAEDVAIPTGMVDADGHGVTTSARDAMDAFDDDALAWDSGVSCMGRSAA